MKQLLALFAVFLIFFPKLVFAGPLAPAPQVVASYERNFLERTGSQTFEELLNNGIIRYFFTGGLEMAILINGRPFASTEGNNLDPIPISAIERIEILRGVSLGTLSGDAVRGAINIVLRQDLEGFEARTVLRLPSKDGGDGRQSSLFWGGAVGDDDEGHISVGLDVLTREEIPAKSREYSRSVWEEGGSFNDTTNVSIGGNTIYLLQREPRPPIASNPEDQKYDLTGDPVAWRSISLGECDIEKGYTGPLLNPPSSHTGDKGCGFAYGNILWNTTKYDQQNMLINLDQPLGDDAEFHLDMNFTDAESLFRYAPSVGIFSFEPSASLVATINEAIDLDTVPADQNDYYEAYHRFVGHGNRDWHWQSDDYDISASIEGQITETLGYDVSINLYDSDGSEVGNTFVHTKKIQDEIKSGNYDLEDPFSQNPLHLQAIENTSVEEVRDINRKKSVVRFALEGDGIAFGDRKSSWTAGFAIENLKQQDLLSFRGKDGTTYNITEVLGSGGTSYSGKYQSHAAFVETALPVTEKSTIRFAGRGDEYEKVGALKTLRLGAFHQATDHLELRTTWGSGDIPPSLFALYAKETQTHPYVRCIYLPPAESPPRTRCFPYPRQVEQYLKSNSNLDPLENKRVAIGAKYDQWPLAIDLELYQMTLRKIPGYYTAEEAMRTLDECEEGDPDPTNCVDFSSLGREIIYNSISNIANTELKGSNARLRWGTRTDWGIFGLQAVWRHISSGETTITGDNESYPLHIPKDVFRLGILAKRGDVNVTWNANYRSDFSVFQSWTGHDLVLDWAAPFGYEGARFTTGVFNLTDTKLSAANNSSSLDGPTEAVWGRTYFLTLNIPF